MNQQQSARDSSETGVPEAARRAYKAPVLMVFGNVEDFTRGTGTKSSDFTPAGTRKVT